MNSDFLQALNELEKDKGIEAEVLLEAIEAALISAYRRNFGGSAQNVRVSIARESGKVSVFSRRTVVDNVQDVRSEIGLEEAREQDPGFQVGDTVEFEVTPQYFGRIAAQTAKQVVVQRIREAERGLLFEEYADKEGDIVTGVVQRFEGRNVTIDLGRAEGMLVPVEQMPGETYRQGQRLKVYIVQVSKTTKGPQITLSRTHPGLLKRLFELEVPEIHDGVVEIQGVAREAGFRSKMAVGSRDENVDPVGACVGPKGMRVQAVVSELRGEKVDIIKYDLEASQFIANALSPAKVLSVELDEDERLARVVVPDQQLSLAIGKEGQNARLAAKLTGWKVDIKSESQIFAEEPDAEGEEQEVEGLADSLHEDRLWVEAEGGNTAGETQEGAAEDVSGLSGDEAQAGTNPGGTDT